MSALNSYRWRKIWIYHPWSLSSDRTSYFINHIREVPVLWEIHLKNGLYCLHFALNIPNGKRKGVHEFSEWTVLIFISQVIAISLKAAVMVFLRSGWICPFVLLMATAFSCTRWSFYVEKQLTFGKVWLTVHLLSYCIAACCLVNFIIKVFCFFIWMFECFISNKGLTDFLFMKPGICYEVTPPPWTKRALRVEPLFICIWSQLRWLRHWIKMSPGHLDFSEHIPTVRRHRGDLELTGAIVYLICLGIPQERWLSLLCNCSSCHHL